ncbi:MAG: PhnD/SsuA/transferrin family substrate-binding protein [Rubrobacter sp.]|nr:PhnD/SsuA/transferrin family substrate-binding protein [Rubrobacter sp.]
MRQLRFITYLSPSIPLALFEAVTDLARRALGSTRVSLVSETRVSGPEKGGYDPFSDGKADVGFLCSPSFAWLRGLARPPVELLGAAPVFEDGRARGRPVYFCDVVARRDGPVRSFGDLEGRSWAYNDACSLSGYHSLLGKLAEMGANGRFFGSLVHSGSHLKSLEAILCGEVDAAAIDSNVLGMLLREDPALRQSLRVIQTWGPFPIQPVVVRSALRQDLKERLRARLLEADSDPCFRDAVSRFGLRRFVPVSHADYSTGLSALGAYKAGFDRVSSPGHPLPATEA